MGTELPADIARLKFPWRRRASDAWTTATLRASVLTFLNTFIASRSWTNAWDVTERYADTAHEGRGMSPQGIQARVPRGPALLFDNTPEEDFQRRPGVRLLVLGVTRCGGKRGTRRMEVSLHFPRGNKTPPMELAILLDRAGASLDAEHRRHPVP